MEDFLEFVDANNQPNGRQAGSYSAQYFFIPRFTRIAASRPGEKSYETVQSSVVHSLTKAETKTNLW